MCPRGYVAAGLDAELSHCAIDVGFLGPIGAPVTPGVATARAVVFFASYVGGGTARVPGRSVRTWGACPEVEAAGFRRPEPGRSTVRRVAQNDIPPGRSAA